MNCSLSSIKTSQQLQNLYSSEYQAPDLFDSLLISHISTQQAINLSMQPKSKTTNSCRCSKTKCRNGYFQCFSTQTPCSSGCECQSCANISSMKGQRDITSHSTNKKKNTDKTKVARKGCTCKKTACQKRYCECYSQGLKCGNECSCIGCNNTSFFKEYVINSQS